jgi:hypothetical protein
MPADLADNAAAVAEGYVRIQEDRGATANPRYVSRYERWTDADGSSGYLRRVTGVDNSSQATADTQALASLNAYRRFAFGSDPTNTNRGPKSGATLNPARN